MPQAVPRLHWSRGRTDDAAAGNSGRAIEWIGTDESGAPVARVVRLRGPVRTGWRRLQAVALDPDSRVVELRPDPPRGADWLAVVGQQVVGRAALPLQAVRTVEAALAR